MASTTANSPNKWIKYCVEHATEVSIFVDSLENGGINEGNKECTIQGKSLDELLSFLSKRYKKLSEDRKFQVCIFISENVKEFEEPLQGKGTKKAMKVKAMTEANEDEIAPNHVKEAKGRGEFYLCCGYCYMYKTDRTERLKMHMKRCKAGPEDGERGAFIQETISDGHEKGKNLTQYIFFNPKTFEDKKYGKQEVIEILRSYGHHLVPGEARQFIKAKKIKKDKVPHTQHDASPSPPRDFDGIRQSMEDESDTDTSDMLELSSPPKRDYNQAQVAIVNPVPSSSEEQEECKDARDTSGMLEIPIQPKRGKTAGIASDGEQNQDATEVLENTLQRRRGNKPFPFVADEERELLHLRKLDLSDQSSNKEVAMEEKTKHQRRRQVKKRDQFKKAQKRVLENHQEDDSVEDKCLNSNISEDISGLKILNAYQPYQPTEIAERVNILRYTAVKEMNKIEKGKKLKKDNICLLNRYIACEICLRQGHRPEVVENWKLQTYIAALRRKENYIECKDKKMLVVPVHDHQTNDKFLAKIFLDPFMQSFMEKYLRLVRWKIVQKTKSTSENVLLESKGEAFVNVTYGVNKLQRKNGFKKTYITPSDARKSHESLK